MRKILHYPIVLPIVALCLYLAGSAPYLGQWDSFDYLKQIVTHRLSPLGIGRPVFVGYNILLWESARAVFHLDQLRVEIVAMAAAVLLGVLGVFLFQRLAGRLLASPSNQMAAIALALSPVYAIYSGLIMTEVPMLVVLMASALILWEPGTRHPVLSDLIGGALFGLAIGIREQALTLGAAFLWILWSRRRAGASRLRSTLWFGLAAAAAALAPALVFYLHDPADFLQRIGTWLRAIPAGPAQFRYNAQASLLYTFTICPGAWLAAAGAGIYRLCGRGRFRPAGRDCPAIPHPLWGFLCCFVVPVAVLWRDADVQMHPRYVLVALPASLILCASVFSRWLPTRRGPVVWAAGQILVFGITLAAFAPLRQTQIEKMEFARSVRESVPGPGLIIAGNLSPVLDYYRGIGLRPGWQVLWSGWGWDRREVESTIRHCWAEHIPVYLSTNPPSWSYLEAEFLDLYFMLKDCRKEPVVQNLFRVYPPG